MGFLGKVFGRKEKESNPLRTELLSKLEVYAEAMHYLATCGHFDAAKFERLDEILSKAKADFGPEKRREMLSQSRYIISTRTTGGVGELRAILAQTLAEAFKVFNETLCKISPTPETARAVKRICDKYKT
jgi:hypothetical protein